MQSNAIPFAQASLLTPEVEPLVSVRTDYVVIDEYFDDVHSSDRDLSTEESSSTFSSFPPAASITEGIGPQENSHLRYQSGESFAEASVGCSKVDQSKTFAAWVAGTILGFLVGAGPSFAMAFGAGAAYCSQQDEGVVGDVARAIGDVALLSHMKFVEVNDKHNLIVALANSTVAFSKNCFNFVVVILSSTNKNNWHPTEQRQTQDAKTT